MNFRRAALALAVVLLPLSGAGAKPISEPADQADRALCARAACRTPTARIVAPALQEKIGQSVVVENRPGGAGSVAVSALTSAPADGYTLMVTDGSTVTVNPALFKSLSYSAKDVVPVALLGRAPLFLAVHADVPVNSLKEFIDYVKANPGQGELRLLGRRQRASPLDGGDEGRARAEHDPRAVSRHRPVGAGAARRPCPGAVLGLSVARRRHRRQAREASRHQRRAAVAAGAGRAADRRR